MKNHFILLLAGLAAMASGACKNYNPSGTPKNKDTTFINRNADTSAASTAGGSAPGSGGAAAPKDSSGQKKDSTAKH